LEAELSRWRSPFSFSITWPGGLYLLSVLLIALAAIRTGNNLLYLMLAILLSAVIASGVAARLSLRSLFVSIQVPQNVFVGESVSVKISLRNQKRRAASFSILAEDLALIRARRRARWPGKIWGGRSDNSAAPPEIPVLQHAAYFPAIPPGEARVELITQSFASRGKYRLDGLRLSTRFPFGFFRRGERIAVAGEVLVYPAIREISSELHLLPFLPGKLEGKHAGPGESLYAIRRYRDGESARLIHWKATAKTGNLLAREYAREEESEFCLILDTRMRSSRQEDRVLFERAVSLAASLAAHFVQEAADFEYLAPGVYVPRGTGTEHLYRILRALAVVAPIVAAPDDPGSSESVAAAEDMETRLSGSLDQDQLSRILSEKVYKIILTSRPRGTWPAPVWHSSYVIYYDEI
jgi:uncharacterized protein (DUF58 family)